MVILYNGKLLDSSQEHRLKPSDGHTLYVEVIGKWDNGDNMHQICTCASEVHINYVIGTALLRTKLSVDSVVFKNYISYTCEDVDIIIVNEVRHGFYNVK